MRIISKSISQDELLEMAQRIFGGLVKAVVDVEKNIMVVDAAMHADEERLLLEHGSEQDDLWGINLYPEMQGDDFIEFDSMINVRPRLHNYSRGIENIELQKKIIAIVHTLVK